MVKTLTFLQAAAVVLAIPAIVYETVDVTIFVTEYLGEASAGAPGVGYSTQWPSSVSNASSSEASLPIYTGGVSNVTVVTPGAPQASESSGTFAKSSRSVAAASAASASAGSNSEPLSTVAPSSVAVGAGSNNPAPKNPSAYNPMPVSPFSGASSVETPAGTYTGVEVSPTTVSPSDGSPEYVTTIYYTYTTTIEPSAEASSEDSSSSSVSSIAEGTSSTGKTTSTSGPAGNADDVSSVASSSSSSQKSSFSFSTSSFSRSGTSSSGSTTSSSASSFRPSSSSSSSSSSAQFNSTSTLTSSSSSSFSSTVTSLSSSVTATSTNTSSSVSSSTRTSSTASPSVTIAPLYMVYSPFNADQSCKDYDTVLSDLQAMVDKDIYKIRMYATDCNSLYTVQPAAKLLGMTIIQGVWIGTDGISNAYNQLSAIIDYHSSTNLTWDIYESIAVGNEDVTNGYIDSGELLDVVTNAKSQLSTAGYTGIVIAPETTGMYIDYPNDMCSSEMGLIALNAHSYFAPTFTAQESGDFVLNQISLVEQACGRSDILITETGYPWAGDVNGNQVPSRQNQADAVNSILEALNANAVILTEYDDLWKDPGPYDIEQHFGVLSIIDV